MKKNFNFTTAFAMRCDAEQFESVTKELEGMGYEVYEISSGWEKFCYIINNYDNTFGRISNVINSRKNKNNRLVIETFNRDLCLALAAMTDKEDGIVGEWFKGSNGTFIQKKDDCDIASIATKATADELIKYFTEAVVISASATNCQAFGNDTKASNYIPIEFKGQLQGFPPEVVEKMLERQVEQGNKRDVSVFEKRQDASCSDGGFDWYKTVEDYEFWYKTICKKDFGLFFTFCSKSKQPETNPQIEALQKRIEDLEYNVKQLAESMQRVICQPEPQPASRFADKQPIWAWDNDWKGARYQSFWDAENECTYWSNGSRNGNEYDKYEPIPADQIPAWMIKAVKYLED